jgi:hypothetical protein
MYSLDTKKTGTFLRTVSMQRVLGTNRLRRGMIVARVRLLRILEYVYESPEDADRDMKLWQIPAIGARRTWRDGYIRSTLITDLAWPSPQEIAELAMHDIIPEGYEPEYRKTRD